MRILGLDLPLPGPAGPDETAEVTLVLLNEGGDVSSVEHPRSLPEVATSVVRLAAGEPFLLGADVPLVVPTKPARRRSVESWVRRRFGLRLAAGGRSAEGATVPGEALMAGLAAAGQPCLPWPDRNRRQSGLLETRPALALKSLLWEAAQLTGGGDRAVREELFRHYAPPEYRAARLPARASWAEQAARLDILLSSLERVDGFDLKPARELLAQAAQRRDVERAAGRLDAVLVAGTARRYLEAPETCLFLGDQEQGYLVLPADSFVRRLGLGGKREPGSRLFPQASLRERLGSHARLREVDLIVPPGKPRRTEASFDDPPRYEFDNVDEMLWWKHCRHLAGPSLPTDGLREMLVRLPETHPGRANPSLRLARSRHRTLSFRFEPPEGWRAHVPPRDGKTYPFSVLRAVYETAPLD